MNFIGTLGFTIVIPFLVFLVTRLGGNAVVYGLIAAAYSTFQFIGAPVLGRWSDRFGRRKILLLSQAGTLASWLIFAGALLLPKSALFSVHSSLLGSFTVTVPLLFIGFARALDGLTGGNISVANAYVADVSTPDDRSQNFGKMGVTANLGMILGPGLAGLLGSTALKEALPVYTAAAISLIGVILIAFALPESRPVVARKDCERLEAGKVLGQETRCSLTAAPVVQPSTAELLQQPNVAFTLGLYFVIMLSFNFFYTSFPIYVTTELSWTVADMGIFFACLSAMLVVVEGPVLARLSKRVSEPLLIIVGLLVLGTNFLLMTSTSKPILYGAAALFALGNGVMWPSMVSVVSKVAEARLQGAMQGLSGSAGSLASVLGLVLGGVSYSLIGAGTFLICAGLAYLSFVLALRLPRLRFEGA